MANKATRKKVSRTRAPTRARDAIALLKADHRQVAAWFREFEASERASRKTKLAGQICAALRTHMTIEEEHFYPAFLEEDVDDDIHHEAVIEHTGARSLVEQVEASGPQDEYYDAKVKVLAEMIKHHVKEEEQPGGMFAKARKSGMDLRALGTTMAERKRELERGRRR